MAESSSITAVIIDDTELMRMTMRAALEQLNVDIIGEAEDGREGIDLVLEHEPDLVMLDVLMPKMNGYLALQEIVGRLPNAFVVMMTSVDDEEVTRASRMEGAQDYILKTTPLPEVIQRLGVHVGYLKSQKKA